MALGILKVAAMVEKHRPVEHLDLNGVKNYAEAVRAHCESTKAEVFALTATTPQMPATARIVEEIRQQKPTADIILGGPHATLVHAAAKKGKDRASRALLELLKLFDVTVAGDGEYAIAHALSEDAPLIIDADDPKSSLFLTSTSLAQTPFPARHLVDVDSYRYEIDEVRVHSIIGQLGCPFGCRFSVSGDTRIFTRYGYESIGDLRHMAQGRLRHCIHGGTVAEFPFRSRVATAGGLSAPSALVAEGYRSLLEITTNNGLKAKVTPEHQLLSVKGCQEHWVKARDLQIGDWVVIRTPHRVWPKNFVELEKPKLKTIPPGGFRRKSEKVPRVLDEDTAWLTGYLIGDGCLPSDGRPAVHLCVTDELSPRLRQTVQEKFGIPLKIKPHSLTSRIKHGWIGSQAAYEFFVQSLGVNPRDKLHVPEAVVRSPKAVIKAFLRGLWAADGYVKGRVNYLTTISSSLARDVADLILMLGSLPYIHAAKRESTKCGKIYRVGYVRQDRIPTEKALYQSSKSGRWHWRTPRQPKCFLGVRRSTLERSGLHHPLNKPGYYYLRVASIKPLKPEPVYDLKVPDEECFVGNGFIFHNCGGRSSPMLRRVRLRPTESVIAEMRHMFETWGCRGFMFMDDELNVNKQVVGLMKAIDTLQRGLGVNFRCRGFIKAELFTEEQAEAMYQAGFRRLLCGFESGSPKILKNINKVATKEDNTRVIEIAKKHGLEVKALMSIGHPGETEQTIRETQNWLLETKPADFDATIITTYPGSPYYDDAVPTEDPKVWKYQVNGDVLYSYELNYSQVEDYYKGAIGEYKSYVYTDHLSPGDLVALRDRTEQLVRTELDIPFYAARDVQLIEHSFGGSLPVSILRKSGETS